MFRRFSRVGFGSGAAILILFAVSAIINWQDPYRKVTDDLILQVAEIPQRTVQLNEYSNIAMQIRQTLHVEEAAVWSAWLDRANAPALADNMPMPGDAKRVTVRADTAVHKIAAFDNELEVIEGASQLSRDLAHLKFYDLGRGDEILADLYQRSAAVSYSLSGMSQGLDDVSTAVASVTRYPIVENIQQELIVARNDMDLLAAKNRGTAKLIPQARAAGFVRLADFVNLSIDGWQGMPADMMAIHKRMAEDVDWLDNFEQNYRVAEVRNARWHFDILRRLPHFVFEYYQPLLIFAVSSLLVAAIGYADGLRSFLLPPHQPNQNTPPPPPPPPAPPLTPQPEPYLTFFWPNGRQERHILPPDGEVVIGNIAIRRARNKYFFYLLSDAFPTFLDGNPIKGAHVLQDGHRLQVGELQLTFHQSADSLNRGGCLPHFFLAWPILAKVHL